MTIAYCRDDPVSARWTGLDRLLTEFEVDYNFYQMDQRVQTLEANYSATISLASITQPSPSTLLFTLTDASTQGPFNLPSAVFESRGAWTTDTQYFVNDTFTTNGAYYRVLFEHISDSVSFDANANDGGGHDYYAEMIPPIGNALPTGGATNQILTKSSGTDYAVTWSYKLPTGGLTGQALIKNSNTNQDADWGNFSAVNVAFSPSTGSGYVSTDVAGVLEEIAVTLGVLGGPDGISAANVSFTPPTGSDLISTTAAEALVEIDDKIAAIPISLTIAASDESTALTTGTAKVTFRMPHAMTLTGVRASLSTAQASGLILTVDIEESGSTILSTKITIDNTEKTSVSAATAAVISDASLADDAEITINIDQVGDGTAKGLKVTLIGTR